MHFLYILLTLRDQFFDNFFLLPYDRTELCVHDARMQFTVHERGTLVLLDVASEHWPHHFDVFREALFLEVADGEFVGIREEMLDAVARAVIFQVVHEMRAVAFDLLVTGDCAENNFGKTLRSEGSEANAADGPTFFDERQRFVFATCVTDGKILINKNHHYYKTSIYSRIKD